MGFIGFYCSSISWGGLEMNFIKSATWLIKRNYRIKFYCVEGSPIANHLKSKGLDATYVNKNRKYYDFSNAYALYKLAKKDAIKAMFLVDTRDISTIALAKTLSGNKFKMIYYQGMQIGVDKKDILHTIRYSKIDAWVTLLDFLANQIQERTHFNHKKIHIIPNAVNFNHDKSQPKSLARKKFNLGSDKFIIGVIGRIDEQKGQLFLIKQLAKLREENLDIELLIVGETTRGAGQKYMNLLLETVRNLKLERFVHFHPFLEDTKVFYNAIDLFAMASKGETFGIVTIEAMACGVPVIGTNASGTPEILENGKLGFLYEVDNGKDFCQKVHCIFNNQLDVHDKVIQAQKSATVNYSQERVTNQFEEVFEKLNLTICKVNS